MSARQLEKQVTIHRSERDRQSRGFNRRFPLNKIDLRAQERRAFKGYANRGFFGQSQVIRYFNEHFFTGPLAKRRDAIESYVGNQYWEIIPKPGERFARFETMFGIVHGVTGQWWTRESMMPQSQIMAMMDTAVLPEWNEFEFYSVVTIPEHFRESLYEGEVGSQVTQPTRRFRGFAGTGFMGGGNQVNFPGAARNRLSYAPAHYEIYLADRSGPSGGMQRMTLKNVNGKWKVDLAELKHYHPKLWQKVVALAAKEKVPLW